MSASFRYWRWRVLRQVPLAVFVAVLGGAATYYGNDLLPDRYTASTHLLVETPSVANDTSIATGPLHHTAQLQSIEARLMTNDRLTSLANQLGRDAEPEDLRDAILFDTSSGRGKPTSLVISVTDADSAFAAAAANTLAEQVLAEHNLSKTNRAESALAFFREEVAEQKSRLDQAFAALLQFKDENAGALPEDASRYHDQRRALLIQRASKGLSVASDPFREQLEMELRSASTLYSADHPRIRGLEAQLAQSEPLAQPDEPAQQISGDISQIDAALALIPANGLRLEALQDAHELERKLYEEAVARLEDAAIAERIAITARGDRITIVEAALPPELPSGPRDKIILALGGLASIALGLGLAILRMRTDAILRRPQDLMNSLKIQPYAVIPRPRYA